MKKPFKRAAAAGIIIFAVIYVVVFNIVRENSVNEALPVMNTVYSGDAYFIAGANTETVYDSNAETVYNTNTETVYGSNAQTVYNSNTETAYTTSGLVNLNTASKDELMSIKGIGEVMAGRIIEYREAHPFTDITELKNIKGIGEKTFDKIAPLVTI
jgi:competence ComEA-like helix-hairpin-helix protein